MARPMAAPPSAPVDFIETDIGHTLAVLWRRRWWLAAFTVAGLLGGIVGSRFLVPKYSATATIWVEQQNRRGQQGRGPIKGVSVLEGAGWRDVYKSFAVLEPVVRRRRLNVTILEPEQLDRQTVRGLRPGPQLQPGVYELEILPAGRYLLTALADSTTERGDLGDAIGATFGFDWRIEPSELSPVRKIKFRIANPRLAAIELRREVDIFFDQRSTLLTAVLTWPNPREGARILNAINDQFLKTAGDLQNQMLAEIVGILEGQTSFAEQRLRSAELALERFRVDAITLPGEPGSIIGAGGIATQDPVFSAYYQRSVTLDELTSNLSTLRRSLADLDGGNPNAVVGIQLNPATSTLPTLESAIDELYQRQAEYRSLLTTYTEEYPLARQLAYEIGEFRESAIPKLTRELIGELEYRKKVLEEQIAAQRAELRQIPSRTIRETRLQREFVMAEQLHNNLLVRLKEAELAEATSLPGLQVLDRARAPREPTTNQAPRIWMLGIVVGAGLGVSGALFHDRLDRKIRDPSHVESRLGLPLLGVIPSLRGNGRAKSVQASTAIQCFRSIRTQIARSGPERGVILITSPGVKDGKTMVAGNLAISYATSGCRTVLVDADVGRGRAEELFKLARSPGLKEILGGKVTQEEATQQTEVRGLSLIARGDLRAFNRELLGGGPWMELLAGLRERFDIVVVDAPPLAAGADVLLLGETVDKLLVVLRAGSTDHAEAQAKLAMIGNVRLPIIGAVLNDVPTSSPYYGQYTYYYPDSEVLS